MTGIGEEGPDVEAGTLRKPNVLTAPGGASVSRSAQFAPQPPLPDARCQPPSHSGDSRNPDVRRRLPAPGSGFPRFTSLPFPPQLPLLGRDWPAGLLVSANKRRSLAPVLLGRTKQKQTERATPETRRGGAEAAEWGWAGGPGTWASGGGGGGGPRK